MHHDEKLRDKLVAYLEDAYAMENHLVESLEKQVGLTEKHPTIQAKVREHLAQTQQHRERIEARLGAYNHKPSAIKGALSSLMGNTQGFMAGSRADALAKTARDDYVAEHLEIAAYTLLITVAQAFGDTETVRVCQLNLRDEMAMQTWLAQHLPEAGLLALQEDGIQIPQASWDFAKQASTTGLDSVLTITGTPLGATDVTGANPPV